jgi:hypothetical protein
MPLHHRLNRKKFVQDVAKIPTKLGSLQATSGRTGVPVTLLSPKPFKNIF